MIPTYGLRVLMVEDSDDDAALVRSVLAKQYPTLVIGRVQTSDEMTKALREQPWDLVLSDFSLPRFNGVDALHLVNSMGFDLPFIIVSGTIGEDIAVSAMKAGAHDFVMKDKLARLVPAIERELAEAEVRRARACAESDLRESEQREALALGALPLAFYTARQEPGQTLPHITWVSKSVQQLTGFAPQYFTDSPDFWLSRVHPEDRQRIQDSSPQQAGPVAREYRWRRANGEYRWFLEQWTAPDSAARTPNEIQGMWLDTTERKNADLRLRESEDRFRLSIDNLLDGFAILSPLRDAYGIVHDFRFEYINEAGCRLAGKPREFVVGCALHDMSVGIDSNLLRAELVRVLETSHPLERESFVGCEAARSHGSEILAVDLKAVKLNDGIALAWRDVTERVRVERDRTWLVAAIEHAGESIVITDGAGRIIYVNPAFEKTSGYSRNEAIGQNPNILKSGKHDAAYYRGFWATILRGEVWKGRFTNRHKSGKLYEVAASVSPVLGSDGKPTEIIAVARDITHELQLEAQIRQTQKMEAVGTLAGGIAHDFNNILTAILGYTEIARHDIPEGSAPGAALEQVYAAGLRAKGLVDQILTFSRERERDRGPVRVQEVVIEALKLLRATLPSTINFVQTISEACGIVNSDPAQIHQIVMNLCTNAFHAMPDGGTLEVVLDTVCFDEESASTLLGLGAGWYTRLQVTDTGHGIDPDIRERIFEPFFTTKKEGKGTGLGLSTVHGIVTSHGGSIAVYSEIGKGTTFRVYLPSSEPTETVDSEAHADNPVSAGSGQHILFLDDEEILVDLGRTMLTRLGYRVSTFQRVCEALDAFRGDPNSFDLVITDQTMPHLTGLAFAHELKSVRPDIPIILTTGFSEVLTPENAANVGIELVLHKPMTLADLSKAIHATLT